MQHRPNPLDPILDNLVQAMVGVDQSLSDMSKDVRPFDSTELNPDEDMLLFHNPAMRYQGQVEPSTGLPYTNAQAAARLLQEIGPIEYTKYVTDVVDRADRRAREGNSAA